MAGSDQYDRMNSAQLEDEAQTRGLDLDEFQSLANNRERAQRLRDLDAYRDADAQVAQQNADAVRQAQEAQAGQETGQASDAVQVDRAVQPQAQTGSGQPQDTASSSAPQSEDSLTNAQAAAAGDLRTDEGIDTSQIEPVGGDPDYTDQDPESR